MKDEGDLCPRVKEAVYQHLPGVPDGLNPTSETEPTPSSMTDEVVYDAAGGIRPLRNCLHRDILSPDVQLLSS
ncbi:hypothetical protein T06_14376 [Trichinella sp. T6]|nr:hypothetical protein T06_14376 [Trichinella sp. T6]